MESLFKLCDLVCYIGLFLPFSDYINLLCICKETYMNKLIMLKLFVTKKLDPLLHLDYKSKKKSPYNYHKKHINDIVKQLLFVTLTGKNFIKQFGPKSGLSRYRQHVLNEHVILPLLNYQYIEKTVHCKKQVVNSGYESDEYIDGNWIYKDTGSYYESKSCHFIMVIKDKHYYDAKK